MNPAIHQRICAEIQERHSKELAAVTAQRDELAKLCNYHEKIHADLLEQLAEAPRWLDVVDELPQEAQEVLFVRGGKVVHGAWIGGIFWYSNQKMAAAKWMPLPQPPKVGAGGTATLGHNIAIEGPEQAQLANGTALMEGSTPSTTGDKDAKRLRWLLEHWWFGNYSGVDFGSALTEDEVRATIDSAMLKTPNAELCGVPGFSGTSERAPG